MVALSRSLTPQLRLLELQQLAQWPTALAAMQTIITTITVTTTVVLIMDAPTATFATIVNPDGANSGRAICIQAECTWHQFLPLKQKNKRVERFRRSTLFYGHLNLCDPLSSHHRQDDMR